LLEVDYEQTSSRLSTATDKLDEASKHAEEAERCVTKLTLHLLFTDVNSIIGTQKLKDLGGKTKYILQVYLLYRILGQQTIWICVVENYS